MEKLVPVFICAVLPIAIVAIFCRTRMNSDNKRAEVLIKAIESNFDIDADKLAEALSKPQKGARDILNARLLRGCVCTFLGMAGTIFGIWLVSSNSAPDAEGCTFLVSAAFLAIGLGFLVTYFVTRKQVDKTEGKQE